MMFLSLRGVIGLLSATSIVIVAAVTLAITLTSSMTALQTVGKQQASALVVNAQILSAQLFAVGSNAINAQMAITESEPWTYPSEDPATFSAFATALETLFVQSPGSLSAVVMYFYDNTQIYYESINGTYFASVFVTASPFSTTFPNSTLNETIQVRRWSDYAAVGSATNAELSPFVAIPLFRVSDGVWQQDSIPQTLNGTAPQIGAVYPYVYPDGSVSLSLTMSGPGYRAGDAHIAPNMFCVAAVTFEISSLSSFLATIAGGGGQSSIVSVLYDGNTNILGSSLYSTLPFTSVHNPPSGTGPLPVGCNLPTFGVYKLVCRANLTEYPYAPLQSLASSNLDFLLSTESVVQILVLDGSTYFVAVDSVTLAFGGMPMWVCLLIPESYILGNVVGAQNTAIGVTAGIFVVVTIATIVLISLLLHPLKRIATRMSAASELLDNDPPDPPSSMAEVHALQSAYFDLNTELNRIRSFVPQSVLAAKRIEKYGDEEELSDSRSRRSIPMDARSEVSRNSRSTRRGTAGATSVDKRSSNASSDEALSLVRSTTATVLLANLSGFHTISTAEQIEFLCQGMRAVVEAIGNAITPRGGVFSFHGDRFFASFNAVTVCAGHSRRAAEAALEIYHNVPLLGIKLPVYCCVSTGSFVVGTMGSDKVKSLSVVGPPVSQAAQMEAVGREFGCHVLATQRTVFDVSSHMDYRYIDLVNLQARDGRRAPMLVAELRLRKKADGEKDTEGQSRNEAESEWLYVVSDGGSVAAGRNSVFEKLAKGSTSEAQALYDALPAAERSEEVETRDGLSRALRKAAATAI